MRAARDEYWSTSLPKDHDALQALDEYCKEWGGLTRTEATRRLLIEWDRLRRGKEITAWSPNAAARLGVSSSSEGARRVGGVTQKPHILNTTAKAASQVLDD